MGKRKTTAKRLERKTLGTKKGTTGGEYRNNSVITEGIPTKKGGDKATANGETRPGGEGKKVGKERGYRHHGSLVSGVSQEKLNLGGARKEKSREKLGGEADGPTF